MHRTEDDTQTMTATLGEVVRFQCHIHAEPSATYKWEYDKKPLPQNDRYVLFDQWEYDGKLCYFSVTSMALAYIYTP